MKDRLSFKGGVMTHFLVHVVSDLEAIYASRNEKILYSIACVFSYGLDSQTEKDCEELDLF